MRVKIFLAVLALSINAGNFIYAQSSVQEDVYTTYSPDGFVQTQSKVLSNNDTLVTVYQYPHDLHAATHLPLNVTVGGILGLNSANILNVPIEKYIVLKKYPGAGSFVTTGQILTYTAGSVYPVALYKIQTSTPIPIASFTPYYYNASTFLMQMDPTYSL